MAYFLMIVCAITCMIQSPFKKIYQVKTSKGTFLFSAMIQFVAALFFLGACVYSGRFQYSWSVLPYSLLFALATSSCCITTVLALRYGPLALTALFASYSQMLPTLYGFVWLKEKIYVTQLVGIALLLVSLYLTNMGREKENTAPQTAKKGNFKKWLPLAIILAVTNGMCGILQTEQQRSLGDTYKNEFMVVALLAACAVLFCVGMLKERADIKTAIRLGGVPAVLTGVANGATNLLVLVTVPIIGASVFFPVISGGGMVLSYIISVTLFKEKFTKMQKIGILLGVASLVFLNLKLCAL